MKVAGFQQHDLFRPQTAIADQALELGLPRRKSVIFGNPVHGHEADIVPVARVFVARVSETYKKVSICSACCIEVWGSVYWQTRPRDQTLSRPHPRGFDDTVLRSMGFALELPDQLAAPKLTYRFARSPV